MEGKQIERVTILGKNRQLRILQTLRFANRRTDWLVRVHWCLSTRGKSSPQAIANRWIRILEKDFRQLFSTEESIVRFPDSALRLSDLGELRNRMFDPSIPGQLFPRCVSKYVSD